MTTDHPASAFHIDNAPDLHSALITILKRFKADFHINGFAVFEEATIDASDGLLPARKLRGPLTAVSITGHIHHLKPDSLTLMATLFREGDTGMESAGGRLISAEVRWAEFVVVPCRASAEVADAPPEAAVSRAAEDWQSLVDVSRKLESKVSAGTFDAEEKHPSVGDRVLHRQFGECAVVKMTDEHILIQKSDGRVVQLGLAILRFEPSPSEGGRNHWTVSVKK